MSGNARSRRRASAPDPSAASTSWDHVAGWYDGWVGEAGSRYHRQIAIPATVGLLEPRPGDRVLDVGCGSGVLAAHVRDAGADYVGVDASPRMIDAARRRHGRAGRFVVGDARRLERLPGLATRGFDAAVFLLSLQDMDDLDGVIESTSRVLASRARIVILLTHPAFRVPRHSGWAPDAGRRLVARRIDSYLRPMAVPLSGRPGHGGGPTTTFHRPISAYVDALVRAGYAIDAFRELPDVEGRSANADIPLFLALRARRSTGHPPAGPGRRRSR